MTTKKASTAARKPHRPKPQDRLPKAEALEEEIEVDVRGFTLTISPDVLDDYDIMSMLGSGFPDPFLRAVAPDTEVRTALLDTCRDEKTGKRRLSAVLELAGEIAQEVGAGN